jgi:predicted nucleic acid-binding Zn ribbon protein
MPRYDFRCRECGAVIDVELPVERASDVNRLLAQVRELTGVMDARRSSGVL